MKKKTTLNKFMNFRYTDLKAVCEYLENMSSDGWELQSMRTIMKFKKTEPRKVRYAVELLDTASAYGNDISEKSQEYIDMCAQAGWKFVCNTGKMYMFRTEDENSPDIVSDNKEKLQNIKSATLKTYFILWFILPALFLFNLITQSFSYGSIAELATSYLQLMSVSVMIICMLMVAIQVLGFVRWYFKAKKALNNDMPIPYIDMKQLKLRKLESIIPLSILSVYLLLIMVVSLIHGDAFMFMLFVILIAVVVLIFAYSYVINKFNVSAKVNITLSVVIGVVVSLLILPTVLIIVLVTHDGKAIREGAEYDNKGNLVLSEDNIPVSLADLGFKELEYSNDAWGEGTFLASKYEYTSESGSNHWLFEGETSHISEKNLSLMYEVYYSDYDFLINSYFNKVKRGREISETDLSAWGAEKAYLDDRGNAIVLYDNYVLVCYDIDEYNAVEYNVTEVFKTVFENADVN